jgi:predicted DNA-binding protein (MmcQ/YjbR family)
MHSIKSKILDYCLSLPHTEEGFPFDDKVWVAKVYGKIFILMNLVEEDVRFNLKCQPEKAEELRAEYDFVQPGYHMSKKHWNTIHWIDSGLDWKTLKDWIDHSYDLVLNSVPKSRRN